MLTREAVGGRRGVLQVSVGQRGSCILVRVFVLVGWTILTSRQEIVAKGGGGEALEYSHTSHTLYSTSTPARRPYSSLQLRCPSQGNRPHPHLHLFKSRCCSKIRKKNLICFIYKRNVKIENREAERLKSKRKREKNDFLCC